ncbi:MAG: putative Cysteine dioxygenase type [Burkholderia sp.]|jgi:predicted metal-dependent enzyme (double-stranded beta helix superfamily)|nr:putative Cysteine dioxygenase type [Burkholderia sp.]
MTAPLIKLIGGLCSLLDRHPDEARILEEGGTLLSALVGRDDWLPEAYARPHPQHYQQMLLHCDAAERYSIVAFIWGPGQRTPIHDHTVWGLIGMLRGAEYSQPYMLDAAGRPVAQGDAIRLDPGQVEAVSPAIGDLHRVHNAYDDRVSISIHVYGANIGTVRRSVYAEDGTRKPFISGYANS